MTLTSNKIRNIAIIAHVDHGKTTLVDGLLKQSNTFRDNSNEMSQNLLMDSGDLERERGITIAAKQTAIYHEDYKINIIDTPGHADFSGEVERILNMADGAILVVDAQEGPMPQTKFVLKKALGMGLKVIVLINKIDKPARRIEEVIDEVQNLFLELATTDEQLEFPLLYAIGRDGKAWYSMPSESEMAAEADLTPVFNTIVREIPEPTVVAGDFSMLVSSLDSDSYNGKYAIGRITSGTIKPATQVKILTVVDEETKTQNAKVDKIFIESGFKRSNLDEAIAGDIIMLTGLDQATIGSTVAAPSIASALPTIQIEPPTMQIAIGPNTSPLAGREGKYCTSRQILERIQKEIETNIGMKLEISPEGSYLVSGRSELHLSVLIETMRREGYEMEVSRPEVVFQVIDGQKMEPIEDLIIEVPEEFVGTVSAELAKRRAELTMMQPNGKGTTTLEYKVNSRAILGLRSILLTDTKGTAIINSLLAGYEPLRPSLNQLRNGVLLSSEDGKSNTYGLDSAQERGTIFITPGMDVYKGMIIGLNKRQEDLEINATREKKLTNIRAAGSDDTIVLTPPKIMSLEEALDFLESDELLEVTPMALRLRKKELDPNKRRRK